MSRITGYFMSIRFPKFILVPMLKLYSKVYGVNTEEMEAASLGDFENFRAFFTRRLKKNLRTIEEKDDPFSICSPCDGTVFNFGTCEEDSFVVVKNTPYKVEEFLFGTEGGAREKYLDIYSQVEERGNELKFILFYLSPGDYHRFHSAAKCTAEKRRHIAGKLYPVKPSYVQKHPNVFIENERVSLFGKWANGFFSTTYIGATNVGSIVLNFDPELQTNNPAHRDKQIIDVEYEQALKRKSQSFLTPKHCESADGCDDDSTT